MPEPVAEPERKPAPVAPAPVAPRGEEIWKDLPYDVINEIMKTAGYVQVNQFKKNLGLTFSELFEKGKLQFRARANAIVILLSAISEGKEGNEKMFVRALATERPTEDTSMYGDDIFNILAKINPEGKRTYSKHYEFPIEAPTEEQEKILTNLFGDMIKFRLERRKGTMGNKSGIVLEWTPEASDINKRTKVGKEKIDNIYADSAKLAKEYLESIEKNLQGIINLAKDFTTQEAKDMVSKKEEVRAEAKKSITIASTAKNAIAYPPDMFTTVLEAFFGDKEKAMKEAKRLKEKFPGQNIKFYGRKNLNVEPVKI
jgi:hypothetical protein